VTARNLQDNPQSQLSSQPVLQTNIMETQPTTLHRALCLPRPTPSSLSHPLYTPSALPLYHTPQSSQHTPIARKQSRKAKSSLKPPCKLTRCKMKRDKPDAKRTSKPRGDSKHITLAKQSKPASRQSASSSQQADIQADNRLTPQAVPIVETQGRTRDPYAHGVAGKGTWSAARSRFQMSAGSWRASNMYHLGRG